MIIWMILYVDFMQASPAHGTTYKTATYTDRSPLLFSDSDNHEENLTIVGHPAISDNHPVDPSGSGWQPDSQELRRQFPLLFGEGLPSQV